MFRHRSRVGAVQVAFTDAEIDLRGAKPGFEAELARIERATGITFARMSQLHGVDVQVVDEVPPPGPRDEVPFVDALVTARAGVGLMVRAADCVPVLLADVDHGVVGAVHAGRLGVRDGVVARAVDSLRAAGGTGAVVGWIGPHVCAGCYEVPREMRAEVSALVPATRATSKAGTPALDLGAGVQSQLVAAGVHDIVTVGGCTREDLGLHSYRRDGVRSGRLAGLVWVA